MYKEEEKKTFDASVMDSNKYRFMPFFFLYGNLLLYFQTLLNEACYKMGIFTHLEQVYVSCIQLHWRTNLLIVHFKTALKGVSLVSRQ